MEAKFCMVLDGSQSVLDDQTRRLSIQRDNETLDLNRSLSQLHSLVTFDISPCSSGFLIKHLSSLKILRVLDLEKAPISNLPNEVSALFNLHYLGLRDTEVEQLPNNIQKLQSLQTLDLLRSRIKKLPHGVTQLKQLRHLFVTASEVEFGETLEEAWQWKNLQTLKSVRPNKNLAQRLEDMKELRTLVVVEVQQAHCPQLCTSLTQMRNLNSLNLSARSELQLNFEMSNSPFPLLQKLDLRGRLFEGKMPKFICSCAELTHVFLSRSHLIEDPLPSLGQLPNLATLMLCMGAFDGQRLHFRTGWFLNLKRLHLNRLKNLNDIVIEEGAMTNLHELILDSLRELKMVPPGVQFLTHLQILDLCDMPEELVGKLRKDNDNNEDRQRIKHIPRVITRRGLAIVDILLYV